MALRNQPYLPLFVKDYSNDVKLRRCSAASAGVYSFLLCYLHTCDEYGAIKLTSNEKTSADQLVNFSKLVRTLLPYDIEVIVSALRELIELGVMTIDGDKLYQKRMVKDGKLSEKRSEAGKKGGKSTQTKNKAKSKQNPSNKVEVNRTTDSLVTDDIDSEIEAKKSVLIDDMVSHFKYTAPQHNKQRSSIRDFVNSLPHKGKLEFMLLEFDAFKALMEGREEKYRIKVNSFIGTQREAWDDGKWDDNWAEQLNNHKNSKVNGTTRQTDTGIRSNHNPARGRSFGKL